MKLEELPTPALVIDENAVFRNLKRLADYATEHELDVRPHTKTHKSTRVAALQIEAGCVGLTAAKVGEAEIMAAATDDLLLAYPAADRARAARLARLAQHKTVRVGVDSRWAVQTLAEAARASGCTLGVLVDLDVGMGRTGVQTPAEALALAQFIDREAGVRLDGMMCYPGHIAAPVAQQKPLLAAVGVKLAETLNLWADHGLEARIVSAGSTPTLYQSHLLDEITEIRPGTYVYNDMNCVRGGYCTLEDCAAWLVCAVVSSAVPGQIIIDAGTKTLTSDRCSPAPEAGHGYILEYPLAKIVKLSEEHGQVDIRQCPRPPRLGERVTVIPNHICPCVNLQDFAWWRCADGELELLTIDARGKLN